MSEATDTPTGVGTSAWYRDVRFLRIVAQIAFAALVIGGGWYLYGNFTTNSEAAGLPTGFDYLTRPTNFDISDNPFRASQPIRDALRVGIQNTMASAAVGVLLATILGVLVGIGRLSHNWLVRKSAQVYVETLRNIPPLVVIVFLFTPIFGKFPQIQEPREVEGWFVFSNRGLWVPWFHADGAGAGTYWWVVAAALLVAGAVAFWRTRLNERTGTPHRRVLFGLGAAAIVLIAGWSLLGGPWSIDGPIRDNRTVTGGIKMGTAYAALTFGLVIYTASHIAEIVRGSIQAVHKGQGEAADALALSGFQRMRYVVLPQAFRIMIPPLANQYLNFTKNTSLATFIGYFEITRITDTLVGNANPAVQSFTILMGIYLTFSLSISFGANAFNRRMQVGSYPWWTPAVPMLYMTLVWFYMGPMAGGSAGAWGPVTGAIVAVGGASLVWRFGRQRRWFGRPTVATAGLR